MSAKVNFHSVNEIRLESIRYVVIVSRYNGKLVLCRHHGRKSWEIPGGHREHGEAPEHAASRELYEETGAYDYDLRELCGYSFTNEMGTRFGILYYADVHAFDELPDGFEMAEIRFFESLPDDLTYPEIQPELLRECDRIFSVS